MVDKLSSMVSMEMDDKERAEMTMPSMPRYPYGLCLSLCQDELQKLNLDDEDLGVGDMLHLNCLAKVTSVSSNETEDGEYCRVELQVTHIEAESEDAENDKEDKVMKLYSNKR